MYEKLYGQIAVVYAPLIDAGAQDFEGTPVPIEAGDAQVKKDNGVWANLSVAAVAFTSGSEEPSQGDTVEGATSTETAVVAHVEVSSGSWGGGDAAGTLFVYTVSGTFQAEDLNIQGGTSNVMTIGADFTVGLFAYAGNGLYVFVLLAVEMQAEQVHLSIRDQTATKEWEDQALALCTTGHPSAHFPNRDIAMRGTDNAALASVATEVRLAELDAANLPTSVDEIKAKTDNFPADPAGVSDLPADKATEIDEIKAKTDNLPADPAAASVLENHSHLSVSFDTATDTLEMTAWMVRNGVVVSTPLSMSITWYNSNGVELFNIDSSSPDAQGVFRLTKVQPLVNNIAYYVKVAATDAQGTITSTRGVPTVGC